MPVSTLGVDSSCTPRTSQPGSYKATYSLITTDRAGTAVLASGNSPNLRQRDPRGTRAGRQARAAEPAGGSERGAATNAAPLSLCLRLNSIASENAFAFR